MTDAIELAELRVRVKLLLDRNEKLEAVATVARDVVARCRYDGAPNHRLEEALMALVCAPADTPRMPISTQVMAEDPLTLANTADLIDPDDYEPWWAV
jgi:hypothetical protein